MDTECRVLICDDDVQYTDALNRLLTRKGFVCSVVNDGPSAVRFLQENPCHVALIDLVMPGMDGLKVLAILEQSFAHVVPVVLSAYGDIPNAVKAMQLGAFDFVEKPVNTDVLVSTIRRAQRHRSLILQAKELDAIAQQWQATFDAMPDHMAIIDTSLQFIRVNHTLADALHCTPEEAIGKECNQFPYIIHLLCMRSGNESPSEASPLTHVFQPNLGRHFLVSTSELTDIEGGLIGWIYVARDVTVQKTTEAELRQAHSEAERLLSTMSSFLIGVDGEQRIVRWNATAEETFGQPAWEVLGKPLLEAGIAWDKNIFSGIASWNESSQPIRLPDMHYTRPDGTVGVLGITVNPIRDDGGASMGFFLLGMDITERINIETQLVQAHKLESIGQLAAGIAHEINTPIQYIGDNLEFLQVAFDDLVKTKEITHRLIDVVRQGKAEAPLAESIAKELDEVNLDYLLQQIPRALEQSLEGVGRVAAIVLAMKEFSHPGTKEKTRTDINHAVRSTITVSRNEWKYVATVETDFDDSLPPISFLPGEFNQVVLNIIVNAAHAIADVVGKDTGNKGIIGIQTRRDGEWVEVRIRDSGAGIPREVQNRVFDPFFTTKQVGKGTGQGLAIARNVIVNKHGGTLSFESEPGQGTTFIIRIPIDGNNVE